MQILIGGLANLAQISQEELTAITDETGINETAFLELFNARESQRVNTIIDNVKKGNGDLLKRAKSEVLSEKEKELSIEFGIEKKTLNEMINSIVDKARNEERQLSTTTTETLTKEKLVTMPIFQELVRESVESIKTQKDAIEKEFNFYKEGEKTKYHADRVKSLLVSEFMSMNPVLPTNEAHKQRAVDMFINTFDVNDFDFDDAGIYKKDENGMPTLNPANAYTRVGLRDIFTESYGFGFNSVQAQSVAGQNGNGNGQTSGQGIKIDFSKVQTNEEAFKRLDMAQTAQEKEQWLKFINENGHRLT